MAAQNQTPFYVSALKFVTKNVVVPAYPGATLSCPRNWAVPPIIGNYWSYNFGTGLRMPVMEVSIPVFDDSTYGVLHGDNGDLFLNTSSDVPALTLVRADNVTNDSKEIGELILFDGVSTVTMAGAKLDGFSLASSMGDDIQLRLRFVGTTLAVVRTSPSIATYRPQWTRSRILRFNAIDFKTLGSLSDVGNHVWSFNLSFSQNHTPNLCLNGTSFPSAQNAGMMGAGLSLTWQATSDPTDGEILGAEDQDWPLGGVPGAVAFTVTHSTGTNKVTTFDLPATINQNPDDRVVSIPRIMRSYNFICLG
jgi:hypothetical protein